MSGSVAGPLILVPWLTRTLTPVTFYCDYCNNASSFDIWKCKPSTLVCPFQQCSCYSGSLVIPQWILGSSLLLLPKQVIDRDCTWSLWEVLSLLGYLLIPFPCLTVQGGICGTMPNGSSEGKHSWVMTSEGRSVSHNCTSHWLWTILMHNISCLKNFSFATSLSSVFVF